MMRNYLPYKSAREYVDRGMAKWMGFFLSEHTSALKGAEEKDDFPDALRPAEKMILLYQAYSNKLTICLTLKKANKRVEVVGKIINLTAQALLLQSSQGSQNIYLETIMQLQLAEDDAEATRQGEVADHDPT